MMYSKGMTAFIASSALFCALASTPLYSANCMDTDNPLWNSSSEKNVRDKLIGLMKCPLEADSVTAAHIDAVACNWFLAQAVNDLYSVSDFSQTKDNKKTWLTANEIAEHVRHSDSWSLLGMANVQAVLNDAAAGAKNGQPVIAVMKGDPHGHVALILPGDPKASTIWKDANGAGLKAPNSAAFSLNNVNKAYVSCRLSAAFSDPKNVEIWWREKKR